MSRCRFCKSYDFDYDGCGHSQCNYCENAYWNAWDKGENLELDDSIGTDECIYYKRTDLTVEEIHEREEQAACNLWAHIDNYGFDYHPF